MFFNQIIAVQNCLTNHTSSTCAFNYIGRTQSINGSKFKIQTVLCDEKVKESEIFFSLNYLNIYLFILDVRIESVSNKMIYKPKTRIGEMKIRGVPFFKQDNIWFILKFINNRELQLLCSTFGFNHGTILKYRKSGLYDFRKNYENHEYMLESFICDKNSLNMKNCKGIKR